MDLRGAGALSGAGGLLVFFSATAAHGGHAPDDLVAVLPEYAANGAWQIVHLGQFLGLALMLGAVVALTLVLGTAVARLGLLTALVTVTVYAVNQAVDGVAVKYVADAYAAAPPGERAAVLLVAEAVRHVEIGLTSMFEVVLGGTLLLFGSALVTSVAFPRWLGWWALAGGLTWVALGVLVAHRGFADVNVTMVASYLLAGWVLVLATLLWRGATGQTSIAATDSTTRLGR